jgi:acyl-CoA synthetase (AMP-forming)/AMP-acid ligase II
MDPVRNRRNFSSQRHSDAVAYGLVQLGYKKGDKLALHLPKNQSSENIATTLGAMKAGVVVKPVEGEDYKVNC